MDKPPKDFAAADGETKYIDFWASQKWTKAMNWVPWAEVPRNVQRHYEDAKTHAELQTLVEDGTIPNLLYD